MSFVEEIYKCVGFLSVFFLACIGLGRFNTNLKRAKVEIRKEARKIINIFIQREFWWLNFLGFLIKEKYTRCFFSLNWKMYSKWIFYVIRNATVWEKVAFLRHENCVSGHNVHVQIRFNSIKNILKLNPDLTCTTAVSIMWTALVYVSIQFAIIGSFWSYSDKYFFIC